MEKDKKYHYRYLVIARAESLVGWGRVGNICSALETGFRVEEHPEAVLCAAAADHYTGQDGWPMTFVILDFDDAHELARGEVEVANPAAFHLVRKA